MGNSDCVKEIAQMIESIHGETILYCEHCGEMWHDDGTIEPDEYGDLICPHCKDENVHLMRWDEYFRDVYDIEYRVSSKHDDIKSVMICVAFGGPSIYVDTGDCKVKLYWWGDYAEAEFSREAADEITDFFNDLWNCE